jgi:glucose dehydrogenase
MGIEVLAVACAVYAGIWLVVLGGSRYFGPQ